MRIQELDPAKRYFVITESDDMTQQDLADLSRRLKAEGVDAVVLAGSGTSVEGSANYFGLYCEQCGVWWIRPHAGLLAFYPAAEIADAHLRDAGWPHRGLDHLWKVQEFGKQEVISPENLQPGVAICPLRKT